jgi:hypothetical protein
MTGIGWCKDWGSLLYENFYPGIAKKSHHVTYNKEFILEGGIPYESCGKFQWNKFRFTN